LITTLELVDLILHGLSLLVLVLLLLHAQLGRLLERIERTFVWLELLVASHHNTARSVAGVQLW
jgi:hypothetical protein